jgi:pilus assembly protein Flp/PilA
MTSKIINAIFAMKRRIEAAPPVTKEQLAKFKTIKWVKVADLPKDETGAALVEYGMLVGLIAVTCVVAITTLGTEVSAAFSSIASSLAGL